MVNKDDLSGDASRVAAPVSIDPASAFARAEALERAGRIGEAEQIYRSLLRAFPNHPWLLNSLALAVKARGDATEAESLLRRAIGINPREAAFHNNLGNSVRVRNATAEAESCYRHALALKPDYPEAHYNLGVTLEEMGRPDEALAAFRQAVFLNPSYAQAFTRIGAVLNERSAFEEALVPLDAAVAAQPNYFDARYYRGLVLSGLERYEDAMAELERAVALKPDSPEALSNLALIAARRSDVSNARAYAERCLTLSPSQPIAMVALAMVDLGEQAFTVAEQQLRPLLTSSQVTGNLRAFALGLLGDALDGQDRIAEAFAAYSAENEEFRRLYSPRFSQSPRAADIADRLITYFEATPANRWRTPNDQTAAKSPAIQHVFLLGFMRSGTTLLEQVLATHPDIVSLEERDVFTEATRDFMTTDAGLDRLVGLKGDELVHYRNTYWRMVETYGVNVEKKVFLNKHPLNTMMLPLIVQLFPNAKILFALRDPRDVVFSCFRRHFGINAATYELLTLETTARFYNSVMRLAALYREKLPLDLHQHRYEDMISDFDAQVNSVCRFIGVEWTDEMKNFGEAARGRSIRSVSASQVRRGMYREGIGQWQRYAKELAPILPVLQPWVEVFGYMATRAT